MTQHDIYSQWKTRRKKVTVPDRFTAAVMQQVKAEALQNKEALPDGTVIFQNRLTEIITAGGMVLLGLFRLFYIIASLFQSQMLVH